MFGILKAIYVLNLFYGLWKIVTLKQQNYKKRLFLRIYIVEKSTYQVYHFVFYLDFCLFMIIMFINIYIYIYIKKE